MHNSNDNSKSYDFIKSNTVISSMLTQDEMILLIETTDELKEFTHELQVEAYCDASITEIENSTARIKAAIAIVERLLTKVKEKL